MQPTRCSIRRLPVNKIYKIQTAPLSTGSRNMSLFFPRFTQEVSPFGHFGQEFAPLSRYFDEIDRAVNSAMKEAFITTKSTAVAKFNPRFDVQETDEAYELTGELPGIDQRDINIQFTTENTLSISGRTEHTREAGTHLAPTQAAALEAATEDSATPAVSDTASERSYQQPTVEDEDLEVIEKPAASTAEGTVARAAAPAESEVAQQPEQPEQPQPKYWVSERSVGEFTRTFPFPARVDQDAVKASLKNGILSVVVPKAKIPAPRRINVE